MKRVDIDKRVLKHARLFLERNHTIRSVAKETGYSKTTVHLDLTLRLPELHRELYLAVSEKIKFHLATRHIRGGEATKGLTKGRKRKW